MRDYAGTPKDLTQILVKATKFCRSLASCLVLWQIDFDE